MAIENEDTVQLKIMASKEAKMAWQVKCKLEKVTLTEKITELMNAWLGGMTLSDAEKEKAEEEELEEIRKMSELLDGATAWPVGEVRKVEKTEVRAGNIPPAVVWVDEVGNWYDKYMALLGKDGKEDDRAGGGTLLWELTWKPALISGWKPRVDDHSFYTNDKYKHVVGRLQERGLLSRDYQLTKKESV